MTKYDFPSRSCHASLASRLLAGCRRLLHRHLPKSKPARVFVVALLAALVTFAGYSLRVRLRNAKIERLANDPQALVKAIQSDELSPTERDLAQKELIAAAEKQSAQMLLSYFGERTKAGRLARLDQMIDQMRANGEVAARGPSSRPSNSDDDVEPPMDRHAIIKLFQDLPPALLSQQTQMGADLLRRMKERGMEAK